VNAERSVRDELDRLGASRVRVEVPDTNGVLRGKYVAAHKLDEGKGATFSDVLFCLTSADEVFENPDLTSNDTGWPDIVAMPDWSTLRPVPWEPGVAAVICDTWTKDGRPVGVDPRHALRGACDRLARAGLGAACGVEYEFFLFEFGEAGQQAARAGRARDLVPAGHQQQAYSLVRWPDIAGFAADLFRDLDAYGVPIESISTELGHGMVECAIAPLPPLQAADAAARFKLGCKALARRHGMLACFVAKPDMAQSGSSGHVHFSVSRDGRPCVRDSAGRLSATGERCLRGLAATAVETSAFMSPFPNSYRRYQPGLWTPTNVTWGHDNRNACLRAITLSDGAARFELRRPGADLNPYLAVAACADGCRHGVEHELPELREAPGRAFDDDRAEPFPADLLAAAEALRQSTLARAWYGDALVDHYALSRVAEHEEWRRCAERAPAGEPGQVPEWELARYLELV
jgi:glutamine synthetase